MFLISHVKNATKKSSFVLGSKEFRMGIYGDQSLRYVTHLFKQYFDIKGRLFNIIHSFMIYTIHVTYIRVSKLE